MFVYRGTSLLPALVDVAGALSACALLVRVRARARASAAVAG
jgi:VanZ family protein